MTYTQQRVERTREKFGKWLAGIDTRLTEFAMGLIAMGIGRLAFVVLPDGKPVAPALNQTLGFLSKDPILWAGALIATGVLVLFGLAVGTRKPGSTWPRAWVNWLLCCFYIAIAIGSTGQPRGDGRALIYAILAFVAAWNTLVLTVEAGIQKANLRIERHSPPEIDRRTVSRNEMRCVEVLNHRAE